ncbi:unnamed protein product [Rhizoctonia solani]|uniref:protein-tyrosine-phosphatase n=1 Tax=Rhizoctonia solani TaxID=456999 RepID=A0A8H2XLN6_9AGAM|nr:unnamed protein product [Rhizoctonia solani]
MSEKEVSVLIVCLGNICRSPMGHAVLAHEAKKRGLPVVVDSAYSVPINHRARVVKSSDFKTFDYILASDNANLSNLKSKAPKDSTAVIALFGAYGDNKPVADPYYGGIVPLTTGWL